MRIDLHIHTNHSPDSLVKPEELPRLAKKKGLNGIAVTDHDRFSACKIVEKAAKGTGILVIPGEEIGVRPERRRICEIIGLFIQEEISGRGKTPLEVIDEIRKQDGIVLLPHPFDKARNVLPEGGVEKLAKKVDAVEVFNAHVLSPKYNEMALEFAEKFKLAQTGGSDSHSPWEVGNAWTEADADDLEGFRKALLKRKTAAKGNYVAPHLRFMPGIAKLRKKLGL